jgi:hypothetical protein
MEEFHNAARFAMGSWFGTCFQNMGISVAVLLGLVAVAWAVNT